MFVGPTFVVVNQFAENHVLGRGDSAILVGEERNSLAPLKLGLNPRSITRNHKVNLVPRRRMNDIELAMPRDSFDRRRLTDVKLSIRKGRTQQGHVVRSEFDEDVNI